MADFDKEYKKLNENQKVAVDTLDGPVLVVAGPGTGKTQLLSMRVANILKKTDTRAADVLCLTFTNKAAINMKDRIIDIAGATGSTVNVKTFHSFAAEIMNNYPDNFWNAAKLATAPDSTQLDIVESIISNLPLDNPLALRFAGQYTLVNDVQRSINLAKDAGLTPDKLKAIIEANNAYIDEIEAPFCDILSVRLSIKTLDELANKVRALPKQEIDEIIYPLRSLSGVITESLEIAMEKDMGTGKTANLSAWKTFWRQTVEGKSGMFKERKRNIWWLNIANVYASYRDQLHLRGFYDYADMLVEVIAELEQNSELLADIQERFNYVLIDEFQDTNPAQLRLAHLVANHYSSGDKPNIMAVGDDDQSIFKFNGAELNNMLNFKRNYTQTKTVVLRENYRSSQSVLDAAAKIIDQAEDRLVTRDKGLNKHLIAVSRVKEGQIRAINYPSRELQLSAISRDVKKHFSPDKSIAILARNHDSLIKLSGILHKLKVPIHYEQQANILEHEIINQLYSIASLIEAINEGNNEQANELIHKITRHELWGIDAKTLWQLAVDNFSNNSWLDSLVKNKEKKLREIGNWFLWLARTSSRQPLAVTIEYILGLRPSKDFTSPLRNYFLSDTESANEYFHGLSAVQLLRSLVNEFSHSKEPKVDDLTRFIDLNRDNHKIIADESPFVSGEHAVQLLTVHKAKGLEFDHVYIVDAIANNWQPREGSRKPPANLPLQPAGEVVDDYVRLMYVAVTRAKSSITISAYATDHAGKDVAISPIIKNAFDVIQPPKSQKTNLIEVLEENLNWPRLSRGDEKAILKARLNNYSLSVTHLFNFLDVAKGGPQYFKERNLLNLPEAKKPHLSYGTAIHEALELAQKSVNKSSFNLKDVYKQFDQTLKQEQLTKAEFNRYSVQGKQTLKKLFTDYKYQLPKGSLPEQDLKDIKLDSATIRGKLDRVDFEDNGLKIIDYKTGSPLTNFNTKAVNQLEKAWRNKTQLIFYALMAKNSSRFAKYSHVEGEMVYVQAEMLKDLTLSYIPSDEEINQLQKLVEVVYQKIINLDLPDANKYSKDFAGTQIFIQDLLSDS